MDTHESGRKLSIPRLLFALVLIAALSTGVVYAKGYLQGNKTTTVQQPWFGAYVDVTATPTFSFQQMGTNNDVNAVLSFVVSSPTDACTPSWGAAYTLDQANASLSLDSRIALLQQRGGGVAISFGGRDNSELAVGCTDQTKLVDAYQTVIDRYHLDTIDLDLEGSTLTDTTSGQRRAEALSQLQTEQRAAGKKLAIWLTLPATPDGLSEADTTMVSILLQNKVDIAGVNVLTMDYGDSLPAGESMGSAAVSALTQTHRQLGILYQNAGIYLNSATLWSKIGATPMIGQNDTPGEIFSLSDAKELSTFATQNTIGRMSMWSANRDIACGSNYVNLEAVSDSCSGVAQDSQQFTSLLGAGFEANLSDSSSHITVSGTAPTQSQIVDNSATSPYQIWTSTGAYVEGTKVVWRKNIYQAKWWTQGDVPDNPVLQSYQTPWELLGPVLPGEKPLPQPTLAPGTYPDWDGTAVYNAGDRVLLDGIPYQAKWWTQGDSPAAAASNPDSSPWVPLTQAQINQVADGAGK